MNLVKSLKHKELPFDYEINKLKVLPPLKHQFSMNGFDQLSDLKSLPVIDNLKPYPTSSIIESSPQMSFIQTLKQITQTWKDGYKQVSLKDFGIVKTEKAPPPADLFANLPTSTNF